MKARGNKLFAGSRMILPEHRQLLCERMAADAHIAKPTLDEQQYEQMERALGHILQDPHRRARIVLWHPQGTVEARGQLLHVDQLNRTLQLRAHGEVASRSLPLDTVLHIAPDE
ncbi:YolD-like family protein [Numidum massiliense]|uniref:YolD-like family protein n=1 Tax=Numidum massiliense TaxID=1522315 RepID=UPI0006D54812|nr:YolD-like family protein [Numidum massiliense]